VRRFDPALTALAMALAAETWLNQVFAIAPSEGVLIDRIVFLTVTCYVLTEAARSVAVRLRRRERGFSNIVGRANRHGLVPPPVGRLRASHVLGTGALFLLVTVQTVLHADERSPFLYMTYPAFQVGAGTSADGYVAWIDGHPTFAESWQFAKLANVLSGATGDLSTGDTDARAAYSYLAVLLMKPLGAFVAFVSLNTIFWLLACLATWYLAATLLGSAPAGYVAALLTACGEGFVFLASTPMSYVAGYAWAALLLALAVRWRLFGWRSDWRRWAAWGWVCGVAGLFYFTHVVLLGAAWLFGAGRTPLRHLIWAAVIALALPAAWFAVGTGLVGLQFAEATANDLFGQLRRLGALAFEDPLRLPAIAGSQSFHALMGNFNVPLLPLAALGYAVAAPRRRQWYAAITACGFAPALLLHQNPVTQRYGYLAYPAIYVAATEGIVWLGMHLQRWLATREVRGSPYAPWVIAAIVVAVQLIQANADLAGVYRFALAFGAL
jgi:hypothetical protein